jgi:hypothetical protein
MNISIASAFTRTPGARYIAEGRFSGEEFRREVLAPAVRRARESGEELVVDLDGTAGYGTSFLKEAFGGLVRIDEIPAGELGRLLVLKSEEEPYLIEDITSYMKHADQAPPGESWR